MRRRSRGLALSPLMGTCLQYSLDFCLAWALIGEWTSRVLFPVPKGPWPRHGHAGALLQNYQCRSPRIVAWARAAFEQGALPSLLMMPGIAPVFSLPGDRMFQATEIMEGRQRPAIMHAYGGAKAGDGKISCLSCYAWHCRKTANVGQCGSPPCCRNNHWLQGVTSQSFWKGKTTYALVLATVGRCWGPGLCPVPMACWNWCGLWTGWALPVWSRTSMPKRQLIFTKLSTYTPWKTWGRMAHTPKSSASLHWESSPMSTHWKPSLQSTIFQLQGICQPSSPMTSGMKRSGGMVTPNLLPLSRMKQSWQMPKSYFPNWRTWWLRQNRSMGWWYGRAHRIALLPSPQTPILYSWLWCLERKFNGTSQKPCM